MSAWLDILSVKQPLSQPLPHPHRSQHAWMSGLQRQQHIGSYIGGSNSTDKTIVINLVNKGDLPPSFNS
jgi:hypothetical protein